MADAFELSVLARSNSVAAPSTAGSAVKSVIFGYNPARLEVPPISRDNTTATRTVSLHAAAQSNLADGYIARRA
jgi:hypothetical protein